jgi:hypothetical protein
VKHIFKFLINLIMCRHSKFYLAIGHIGTKTINLSRLQQRHHISFEQPRDRTKSVLVARALKFLLCSFVAASFLAFDYYAPDEMVVCAEFDLVAGGVRRQFGLCAVHFGG